MIEDMIKKILVFALALFSVEIYGTEKPAIIPVPEIYELSDGKLLLGNKIYLNAGDLQKDSALLLINNFNSLITNISNKKVILKTINKKGNIYLKKDGRLHKEAYVMDINGNGIKIKASSANGFFYGLQTLAQLVSLSEDEKGRTALPFLHMEDSPRFSWRGFMLDEGRHFFGKEQVKKLLDVMAMYKMNKFHWHLTEDQGWRIEIKKYPKLTDIGGKRQSTSLGWKNYKEDDIPYSGYYTGEDIKEIVKYAGEKFIDIIPEIDLPGHSQAAIASYPEILACDPENEHKVWTKQGVSSDVINVASEKALQFTKDVLEEVARLFPCEYLHLGGDECPTDKWKRNEDCIKLLDKMGSRDFRDLQIYFYKKLQDDLKSKNIRKKLIFWNEVLHADYSVLGKDIVIMAWVGADKAALEAASSGLKTILTPQIPYYINRKQSESPDEPLTQGQGKETLEKVYEYDPLNKVPEKLKDYYMGVQANCWTEYISHTDLLEYVLFPRLIAVAEASWSMQSNRNCDEFKNRLRSHEHFMKNSGLNYCKLVFKP